MDFTLGTAVVVTKTVMLHTFFLNFGNFKVVLSFFNQSISIRYLFINIFNHFFQNFVLSELYWLLETNPLILGTLVSLAFAVMTNLLLLQLLLLHYFLAFILSILILPTSAFELAKYDFSTNLMWKHLLLFLNQPWFNN